MKIIFYTLLFLLSVAMPLIAQDEPCPPTGVTTDPDEPVNNQHSDYINDHFDWTEELYDVYFAGGNIIVQANPYTANNGGVTNLYLTGDYEPEDGWELLYVDFGFDKDGNLLPSPVRSGQLFFVLYNKYRSFIRVFMAIDELDQNNLIEVKLDMLGAYNTALLASIDKVQQPLKSFDPTVVASNAQKFTNGASDVKHWHYADFPVNYDPCTCEAPPENPTANSILRFEVNLIKEAEVVLNGFSNGTAEIKAEKASPTSSGSDNWDKFYGTVKKAGKFVEAGTKGYKNFSLFKADAKSTADGKGKETEMKSGIDNLGNFLTNNIPALKFVPYASEALAIIDFFVGGGKKAGPQEVTFPPLSIQLEHFFSGEITSNFNYITKPIFTPGSSFTPDDDRYSFGDDRYPIYNEVLGLYTVLDKPHVTMWKGYAEEVRELDYMGYQWQWELKDRSKIIRRAFQVDANSVKIAVNEASNLSLDEAYVQVHYYKEDMVHPFKPDEGIAVSNSSWVSPLIPLGCAHDRLVVADIIQENFNFPVQNLSPINDLKVDLSLTLVFKNSSGHRFLHKATWATELEEMDYPYEADKVDEEIGYPYQVTYEHKYYNWFDKPEFQNLETGFFLAGDNLYFNNTTIEQDTSAVETIVVENGTIEATSQPPVNNGYTNLLAGQSIEILPGTEIRPNSDLEVTFLGMNCNVPVTLATASEIASICEDDDYQGQKIFTKKFSETELTAYPEPLNFMTFPNPADEYLKISLSNDVSTVNEIEVTIQDITGRSILLKKKLRKSGEIFELETTELSAGIYLLKLQAGTQNSVRKIVIR